MSLSPTRSKLAALAAASLLVLTACGSDGDDGSNDASANDSAATDSTGDTADDTATDTTTDTDASESPGQDTEQPAEEPSDDAGQGGDHVVTAWFVGDGPRGPVLFPEQVAVSEDDDLADELTALMTTPKDPDYRTLWQQGSLVSAEFLGNGSKGLIRVEVSADATSTPDGASPKDAKLALQQVVHTLQEAVGKKAPVEFLVDGKNADQVLGVPTTAPVKQAPALKTLSLMTITTPAEGEQVSGSFTATGANNGFEAWVGWQLLDADGKVVKDGFTTAAGWMGNKLFDWKAKINVAGVPAGDYVLRFHNDDPSGGTEGSGPAEDTRSITIS